MQAIDKELHRKEEFNESLDRLAVALRRIQLRDIIPADFDHAQREGLECAALDLCASVCNYLTFSLKYFRRSLVGNIPTESSLDIRKYIQIYRYPGRTQGLSYQHRIQKQSVQ